MLLVILQHLAGDLEGVSNISKDNHRSFMRPCKSQTNLPVMDSMFLPCGVVRQKINFFTEGSATEFNVYSYRSERQTGRAINNHAVFPEAEWSCFKTSLKGGTMPL